MSFIKEIIESPHSVYDRYIAYWGFLLQSYEGGVDYSNSLVNQQADKSPGMFQVYVNGQKLRTTEFYGNMFRHKKEREEDYIARIQMSYYYNFCSPVIDIYTNHLFKQPVNPDFGSIEDDVEVVGNNIDLKGSSVDELRKQMAEMAQVYGHLFAVVDSPKLDEKYILTKRDQIDNRAYPYVCLYDPQSVINWSLDAYGNPYWVLLREYKETNVDPMNYDKSKKYDCNYKLWTRTYWTLFDSEYNVIETSLHPLGVVPIVCVFNKKSKKVNNFLGISSLADISFISRDIYNSCSELKQILRDQTFAILALQGSSDEYDEISVGTSKALLYPPERNAPQYVSPQSENAKNYFDHIDRQISKIYQLAKLEGGSASFNGQTAVNQSGVSKAWDFNQTNSALSDKAGNLEDAENKIWSMFALWLGKEFEGSIQYPKEFSTQSLMDDLVEAEKASRLSLGKTFDVEVRKAIHKKKFPSATEDQLEKMEKEVEGELERTKQTNGILSRVPSLNRFNNANLGGN